jgi:hypothetical protein
MLILRAEDLYTDSIATLQKVLAFLELPAWAPTVLKKPKAFPYPKMSLALRTTLTEYFRPYNQQLASYLGIDYGWDAA